MSVEVVRLAAPVFLVWTGTVAETVAQRVKEDPAPVDVSLELDRPPRRPLKQELRNESYDPGMPDGPFGPIPAAT